jgi:hypothetical protein
MFAVGGTRGLVLGNTDLHTDASFYTLEDVYHCSSLDIPTQSKQQQHKNPIAIQK